MSEQAGVNTSPSRKSNTSNENEKFVRDASERAGNNGGMQSIQPDQPFNLDPSLQNFNLTQLQQQQFANHFKNMQDMRMNSQLPVNFMNGGFEASPKVPQSQASQASQVSEASQPSQQLLAQQQHFQQAQQINKHDNPNSIPASFNAAQQRFIQQRQMQMEEALNSELKDKARILMAQQQFQMQSHQQQQVRHQQQPQKEYSQSLTDSRVTTSSTEGPSVPASASNNMNDNNMGHRITKTISNPDNNLNTGMEHHQLPLRAQTPNGNFNANNNFVTNEVQEKLKHLQDSIQNSASNGKLNSLNPGMFSHPTRKYIANIASLKVYEFFDAINSSSSRMDINAFWKNKVRNFFQPTAFIRFQIKDKVTIGQDGITVSFLPTYFAALYKCGIARIELNNTQLRTQVLSNGTIYFNSPRLTLTCHYLDGSYVTHFTQMKGLLDQSFKMMWLEVSYHNFVPGVEWNSLERLVNDPVAANEVFGSIKSEVPTKEEEKDDSDLKSNLTPNLETIKKLRSSFFAFKGITQSGFPADVIKSSQLSDAVSLMANLLVYKRTHNIASPVTAYKEYVDTNSMDKQAVSVSSNPLNEEKLAINKSKRRTNPVIAEHTRSIGAYVQQQLRAEGKKRKRALNNFKKTEKKQKINNNDNNNNINSSNNSDKEHGNIDSGNTDNANANANKNGNDKNNMDTINNDNAQANANFNGSENDNSNDSDHGNISNIGNDIDSNNVDTTNNGNSNANDNTNNINIIKNGDTSSNHSNNNDSNDSNNKGNSDNINTTSINTDKYNNINGNEKFSTVKGRGFERNDSKNGTPLSNVPTPSSNANSKESPQKRRTSGISPYSTSDLNLSEEPALLPSLEEHSNN